MRLIFSVGVVASMMLLDTKNEHRDESRLYKNLEAFVVQRECEFDQIPEQRKAQLTPLVKYLRKCLDDEEPVRLNFICTHNSRRSHMSQIWAATAAVRYGILNVHTYSGGTESTAFNPRAVRALQRSGFKIKKTTDDDNPIYHVYMQDEAMPITAFSKVYNNAPNPKNGFCAVMTCTQADKACPTVNGARLRVAIPYKDPKAFDNTSEESAKYDERCRQISREMLFVFSQVRASERRGIVQAEPSESE